MTVDPASAAIRAPAPRPVAPQDAGRAAQEFESVFLTRVVEEMLGATDGLLGGGPAEGMWRGVLARAVADGLVRGGGVGLAQSVERTITAYGTGRDVGSR